MAGHLAVVAVINLASVREVRCECPSQCSHIHLECEWCEASLSVRRPSRLRARHSDTTGESRVHSIAWGRDTGQGQVRRYRDTTGESRVHSIA